MIVVLPNGQEVADNPNHYLDVKHNEVGVWRGNNNFDIYTVKQVRPGVVWCQDLAGTIS